jgi:predicted Zn-dependent protease
MRPRQEDPTVLSRALSAFAASCPRALVLLAMACAIPAPGLAADVPLSERIGELEQLVGSGRCDQALEQLSELREAHPRDPDLLVLQGNCLVRGAESSARSFDRAAYERLRIAFGEDRMPRELTDRFYAVELTFDEAALQSGLERFRRAIELAPDRADLIVGTAAVLSHAGRVDEALELLAEHRGPLGHDELMELSQLVEDRMAERRLELAGRLAAGLTDLFPEHEGPRIAMARLALDRHRALSALDRYAEAWELARHNEAVANELNRLRLLAGRFEAAVEDLVPLTGKSSLFRVWLALARSVESPGSASRLWEDLAGRVEDPLLDGPTRQLIQHYNRLLGGERLPTAAMRLRGARLLASRGMSLPAVIEARAAVSAQPGLVEGWVLMSRIFRGELLFDLAVTTLESAIEQTRGLPEPSRPFRISELQAWRAELLLGLGESEAALQACAELEGGPDARPYVRALAAMDAGKESEARRLLEALAASETEQAAAARARLAELDAGTADEVK